MRCRRRFGLLTEDRALSTQVACKIYDFRGERMNRREAIGSLAAFAISGNVRATFITSQLDRIGSEELDFHGYVVQKLSVDGCKAYIVRPRKPLQGKPWVWRAMFWDQYPGVDLALLEVGFHL